MRNDREVCKENGN